MSIRMQRKLLVPTADMSRTSLTPEKTKTTDDKNLEESWDADDESKNTVEVPFVGLLTVNDVNDNVVGARHIQGEVVEAKSSEAGHDHAKLSGARHDVAKSVKDKRDESRRTSGARLSGEEISLVKREGEL